MTLLKCSRYYHSFDRILRKNNFTANIAVVKRTNTTKSVSGTYYQVLEIPTKATHSQIKTAYYKLSKKCHPDLNKNDPDAEKKFAKISAAYQCLGNRQSRRMYDGGYFTPGSTSSTTQTQSTPFSSKTTEAGYDNLMKQSYNKTGSTRPTGRNQKYDFDQYYKENYHKMIKENNRHDEDSKKYKQYVDGMKKHEQRSMNMSMVGCSFLLVLFIAAQIYSRS